MRPFTGSIRPTHSMYSWLWKTAAARRPRSSSARHRSGAIKNCASETAHDRVNAADAAAVFRSAAGGGEPRSNARCQLSPSVLRQNNYSWIVLGLAARKGRGWGPGVVGSCQKCGRSWIAAFLTAGRFFPRNVAVRPAVTVTSFHLAFQRGVIHGALVYVQ